MNKFDLNELINNIKQQVNNVKQQRQKISLFFITKNSSSNILENKKIETFFESSNILKNNEIVIFNSNFDFFDFLNVVNNEIRRILDRHLKFRFKRVFIVDFLIDLIVLFKISLVNSYELKIYKQTIIDIYHKMK